MPGHPSLIINSWHSRYYKYWFRYEHYLRFDFLQSFGELSHRPILVDLTVEDQTRLKVIYGSIDGFHAVDLDSANVYDIYLPKHVCFNDEIENLIFPLKKICKNISDSRTNYASLYCHITEHEWYESFAML